MLSEYGDLVTIDELCEILMIGRNTAYRLLNDKKLAGFRIGRCWKIPKAAVEKLLQNQNAVL